MVKMDRDKPLRRLTEHRHEGRDHLQPGGLYEQGGSEFDTGRRLSRVVRGSLRTADTRPLLRPRDTMSSRPQGTIVIAQIVTTSWTHLLANEGSYNSLSRWRLCCEGHPRDISPV